MEIKGGHQNKLRVCIAEAIGTGLLLFSINWGAAGTLTIEDQDGHTTPVIYGAFSTASTLFACIYMFGSVSGAHFNPAITIAVLIKEGEKNLIANIIFAFQIVVSQTIGGIIGCLLSLLGMSYKGRILWPNIALLCPPTLDNIKIN
jgi:glycerol uptake facilitator-like aquaporin